jgi:hypothetical protein
MVGIFRGYVSHNQRVIWSFYLVTCPICLGSRGSPSIFDFAAPSLQQLPGLQEEEELVISPELGHVPQAGSIGIPSVNGDVFFPPISGGLNNEKNQ